MTESCELIEHSYDVVIVGAGSAAMRAALGMAAFGIEDGLCDKCLPDPQPYGGGTRRHSRLAR